MTLEPRLIEPGYLKRWPLQALKLIGRNFHLWFALAMLFSGVCYLVRGFAPVSMAVGVVFCFFSVNMAAASTQRMVNPGETLKMLGNSFGHTMLELWDKRYPLTLIFVITALIGWAFDSAFVTSSSATAPQGPPDYSDIKTWLFSYRSPLAEGGRSILLATIVFDSQHFFGFIKYPLRLTYGLSEELAFLLCFEAAKKNEKIARSYGAYELTAFLFLLALLPGLAPLALCLVPTIHFIVFKELFDPDGLPAQQSQEQSAPVAATASNG